MVNTHGVCTMGKTCTRRCGVCTGMVYAGGVVSRKTIRGATCVTPYVPWLRVRARECLCDLFGCRLLIETTRVKLRDNRVRA
jgi:hypothetical protein